MVKLLVEIVIMNRSADIYLIQEIKEKLIEWRGKVYDNDNAIMVSIKERDKVMRSDENEIQDTDCRR